MDSKSKPYGRIGMRLKIIFDLLAYECEHRTEPDQRKWAKKLVEELSIYGRLVLAGLLADLTSEHRKWMRDSDKFDPEAQEVYPADVASSLLGWGLG